MSDDPFQRRLDAINKEMADLLQHDRKLTEQESPTGFHARAGGSSSSYRDPALDGAMQPSPHKHHFPSASPGTEGGGHAQHGVSTSDAWAAPRSLAVSSQDLIRREVHQAVSREVKALEDNVREMVQREWDGRVRELDAVLRTRFQELKVANDGLSKVVIDVAENFQSKLDDLAKRIDQQEADWKRSLVDVRRELVAHSRSVQSMGDVVADVESQLRADSRSVDQRVEAIVKRHGELVRSTLQSMDEKVVATQRDIEAAYRESKKQIEGETDQALRLVNRLQASVEASGSALERAMHELQVLGEGVAANQSGLRACRSDVNRLDITVRSVAGGSGAAPLAPVRNSNSDAASPLDLFRMQQDIFALKECVAFLHSAVTANGGGAVGSGGGSLPFAHLQQHRAPHAATDFGDDDEDDAFYGRHGAHPQQQRRHHTNSQHHHNSKPAHQSSAAAPLNINALSRPPYVTSTRSTPTKATTQQHRASLDPNHGGLEREGSAQWSDGNGSGQAVPSPTYRTVPDSDSDDERENSKLARSELD